MIQRIQTLFLILVIIANILIFFFPLTSYLTELNYYKLYITELKNMTPSSENHFGRMVTLPLILLNIAMIFLTIVSIFKYKNRLLQIRLNKFNILLTIFLIVGIFFGYPKLVEMGINASPVFNIGVYFPIASLILLFFANMFISKDEKLIKSADRLR